MRKGAFLRTARAKGPVQDLGKIAKKTGPVTLRVAAYATTAKLSVLDFRKTPKDAAEVLPVPSTPNPYPLSSNLDRSGELFFARCAKNNVPEEGEKNNGVKRPAVGKRLLRQDSPAADAA